MMGEWIGAQWTNDGHIERDEKWKRCVLRPGRCIQGGRGCLFDAKHKGNHRLGGCPCVIVLASGLCNQLAEVNSSRNRLSFSENMRRSLT